MSFVDNSIKRNTAILELSAITLSITNLKIVCLEKRVGSAVHYDDAKTLFIRHIVN